MPGRLARSQAPGDIAAVCAGFARKMLDDYSDQTRRVMDFVGAMGQEPIADLADAEEAADEISPQLSSGDDRDCKNRAAAKACRRDEVGRCEGCRYWKWRCQAVVSSSGKKRRTKTLVFAGPPNPAVPGYQACPVSRAATDGARTASRIASIIAAVSDSGAFGEIMKVRCAGGSGGSPSLLVSARIGLLTLPKGSAPTASPDRIAARRLAKLLLL